MPVRRRRIRQRTSLTMADLNMNDITDLTCGWGPGWRGSRWQTEEEFLDDYEVLRDEILNRPSLQQGGPVFAEELWQKRRGAR